MEGGAKRHRIRKKKQIKAENLEMGEKDRKVSLPIKIKNYPKRQAVDLESSDQATADKKKEFVADWQADKEERKKRMLMWGGVIFFMVIIVVGWAVMFRQSFSVAKNNGQSLLDWQKWNQAANDISKNFEVTAGQLQTMKSLLSQAAAQNASGTNATAASLSQTELNNMKTKILEMQLEKATTTK